jgi:hypothetical protein
METGTTCEALILALVAHMRGLDDEQILTVDEWHDSIQYGVRTLARKQHGFKWMYWAFYFRDDRVCQHRKNGNDDMMPTGVEIRYDAPDFMQQMTACVLRDMAHARLPKWAD